MNNELIKSLIAGYEDFSDPLEEEDDFEEVYNTFFEKERTTGAKGGSKFEKTLNSFELSQYDLDIFMQKEI
jgi:hypothetical protein